ncbi:MAG TPA: SagB/ThcOx family dehydrogenase, partial [Planctomycetaceae bacterium]|nr:SagB/ThcOx family dehydrogenase [Planctomycetaceae bacterium]
MSPHESARGHADLEEKIGDLFQELTKYDRHAMRRRGMIWPVRPALYKSYPDADRVALPTPAVEGGPGLWSVAARRRSHRTFASKPLSLEALSQLLWATQGITCRLPDYTFRAAPSAGALYPVETYVVAHRVETIEPGVYHYDVRAHALERIAKGDHRDRIAKAALDQSMAAQAAAVFVWTAVVDRAKWK